MKFFVGRTFIMLNYVRRCNWFKFVEKTNQLIDNALEAVIFV